MSIRRERTVSVRDLSMHVVEEGEGDLVLLCHGFPETSWSWRHQQRALAEAGFRTAAPDLRGYGATTGPAGPDHCDIVSLAADLVALVEALGESSCHLVGHDFGALLSWHAAALHPEVFRSVACLSVGFPSFLTGPRPPLQVLSERSGDAFHYISYFQKPGVAEAEMEADVRGALARIYWSSCGEVDEGAAALFQASPSSRRDLLGGFGLPPPGTMSWLTDADLDVYAGAFEERGFAGPLSWYRAMDRSWEALGQRRAAKVEVPALYVAGLRDAVVRSTRGLLERMRQWVPHLEGSVMLEGCGHWTQQERSAEVSTALRDFLVARS